MARRKIRIKKKQLYRPILFGILMIALLFMIVKGVGSLIGRKVEQPTSAGENAVVVNVVDRGSKNSSDNELFRFLSSYFKAYYQSLGNLTASDLSSYYDLEILESYESAQINQAALDYMIAYRSYPDQDLTFAECTIGMVIQDTSVDDQGDLIVEVVQDETMAFGFLPDVKSSISGTVHTFVLTETEQGYLIVQHSVEESIYLKIYEEVQKRKSVSPYGSKDAIKTLVDQIAAELESKASIQLKNYQEMKQSFNESPQTYRSSSSIDHAYDRTAAVAYADKWVDAVETVRNSEQWSVYDGYGGNCNNYVSQCLIAGGIPMDTSGDYIWKWYGDESDSTHEKNGRSPSWTGVNSFYKYSQNNEGYGLLAEVGGNLYRGQVGDVLIMTSGEVWSHVVIITEVVTDDQGNVIDYLIHSNTSDRLDFPLSAYGNVDIELIHILGWNE